MDAELVKLRDDLEKALSFLHSQYGQLQVGKATPGLVDSIEVDVYGTMTPIRNIANINIPDPRSIAIQPWDKSNLAPIEKAIGESELNLNPMNDGTFIRLNLPPLTEERRKELVKLVHKMAEDARITLRQEREKVHKQVKEQKKNEEISEDDLRHFEKKLQEVVDEYNKKIDESKEKKEQDIMTV